MSDAFVSADQIDKWKRDMVRVLEQIPSDHRMYIWELALIELREKELERRRKLLTRG